MENKSSADKKAVAKKPMKVSRFLFFLGLVVGVLLLIVNDSVTVEALVAQISSLDSTYDLTLIRNDSLKAELKKLSSAERITRIASQRLGLQFSSQPLDEIRVDKAKLEHAEREDAKDSTR